MAYRCLFLAMPIIAYHCLLLPIVAYFWPPLGKSHFLAWWPPMAYRCLFLAMVAYYHCLSLPIISYHCLS